MSFSYSQDKARGASLSLFYAKIPEKVSKFTTFCQNTIDKVNI